MKILNCNLSSLSQYHKLLLVGAVLTFVLGYAHFNWSLIGEFVLSLISVFDGIILIGMATTDDIWMAYLGYWAFRILYQMLITVARYFLRMIKIVFWHVFQIFFH